MNYLAHLYLAKDSDELLVGNFIGDFVKGKLNDRYPPEITRGIVLHRKIDVYTDSHPIVKDCRSLVSSRRRRFSGVMIDVFFDHFLNMKWSGYSTEPLDEFIMRVCSVIAQHEELLPPRAKKILPAIRDRNWLGRYRNIDDLGDVFEGLSRRISRENPLPGSEKELLENYSDFERYFNIFFPQIVDYSERVKKQI